MNNSFWWILSGHNDMQTLWTIVNYLVNRYVSQEFNSRHRKRFFHESKNYLLDEPDLYRKYVDQLLKRCVDYLEACQILLAYHNASYGGHFGDARTTSKFLPSGYFWPSLFKYANELVKTCDIWQSVENIFMRQEMALANILENELFDVWGIDFMVPFPQSFCNLYMLMVVDFISKWIEAKETPLMLR